MVDKRRLITANIERHRNGGFILYWMQAAVRCSYNPALEYAVELANGSGLPLAVVFCLDSSYPEANLRHFTFLIEGLRQASAELGRRGMQLSVFDGRPGELIPELAGGADALVTDFGYTKIQRRWRREIAQKIDIPMYMLETEAVVPVTKAYPKAAWSAAVLRPAITRELDSFLVPEAGYELKTGAYAGFPRGRVDIASGIPSGFSVDVSVKPVDRKGGCLEAAEALNDFIENRLNGYTELQRDPVPDGASKLSAYLHFGHISPVEIALAVLKKGGESVDRFLEQLIVRRELAMNHCYYNDSYDSYDGLPGWAKETLSMHSADSRTPGYSAALLEAADTEDKYWNAAQREMLITGYMHNYMRMYWGKKILEWSSSPRAAFDTALRLNNKYFLDGRDPNGFTGVGWCFGLHDRPWAERDIFGKIRYMNDKGLKRKFDIDSYVARIDALEG